MCREHTLQNNREYNNDLIGKKKRKKEEKGGFMNFWNVRSLLQINLIKDSIPTSYENDNRMNSFRTTTILKRKIGFENP